MKYWNSDIGNQTSERKRKNGTDSGKTRGMWKDTETAFDNRVSALFAGLRAKNVDGVVDHLSDVDAVDGMLIIERAQLVPQSTERRPFRHRLTPTLHHQRIPVTSNRDRSSTKVKCVGGVLISHP